MRVNLEYLRFLYKLHSKAYEEQAYEGVEEDDKEI